MNPYTNAVVVPAPVGTVPTRITSANVCRTKFQVPQLLQSETNSLSLLLLNHHLPLTSLFFHSCVLSPHFGLLSYWPLLSSLLGGGELHFLTMGCLTNCYQIFLDSEFTALCMLHAHLGNPGIHTF